MKTNNNITSYDDILDLKYGKTGSAEREEFRREAYAYYMGQIIHDARKKEKITQIQLAEKVGTSKSYISKIENGVIEPGISIFCKIINALGLRVDIVKPMG